MKRKEASEPQWHDATLLRRHIDGSIDAEAYRPRDGALVMIPRVPSVHVRVALDATSARRRRGGGGGGAGVGFESAVNGDEEDNGPVRLSVGAVVVAGEVGHGHGGRKEWTEPRREATVVACHIDNSYDIRYTDRRMPTAAKRVPRRAVRPLTAGPHGNGRSRRGGAASGAASPQQPAAAQTQTQASTDVQSYTNGLIRRLRAELLRFTGGGAALANIWQVGQVHFF